MSDINDDMFRVPLLNRDANNEYDDNYDYELMEDDDSIPMNSFSSGIILIPNESTVYDEIREISDDGLDLFLTKLYRYYLKQGYWNIVISQITEICIFTFFVIFCLFIFGAVDYSTLLTFRDPTTTHSFSQVVHFEWLRSMNAYFIISLVIFGSYVLWKVLKIIYDAKTMWKIHNFYKHDLGISDFELQTIRWNVVIKRLNNFIQTKGYDKLEAWNISARIMKKDNYLIAMIHHHILKYGIPILPESWNNMLLRHCINNNTHSSNDKLQIKIFSKVLLWSLTYCVINFIVNERNEVKNEIMFSDREHIKSDLAAELKKKFRILSVLNLILLPFLALFVPVYAIFHYGEEFYKNPNSLSQRDWGFAAKWKFREYNELPHIFKARMKITSIYADQYLNQFPFGVYENFAKIIGFISSSIIVYLVFLTIINDNTLFNVELTPYKSLFWWIGLLTTIWVVSKSIMKNQSIFFPEKKMTKLNKFLRWVPEVIVSRPNSIESVSWVKKYFKFKIVQLLEEVVSIFINPFVLWFYLGSDESIEKILKFVRQSTIEHSRLGKICEYSVFEIDKERDIVFKEDSIQRCSDKKMEQSIKHFNDNVEEEVSDALISSDLLATEIEKNANADEKSDDQTLFKIISSHKPNRV